MYLNLKVKMRSRLSYRLFYEKKKTMQRIRLRNLLIANCRSNNYCKDDRFLGSLHTSLSNVMARITSVDSIRLIYVSLKKDRKMLLHIYIYIYVCKNIYIVIFNHNISVFVWQVWRILRISYFTRGNYKNNICII